MWKRLLAWTFVVGALLVACESESDSISTPLADASDPDGATDAAVESDASLSDAAKDAGKTKDAKPTGTGACNNAPDDAQCMGDGGAPGICCDGECVSPYDSKHCQSCAAKCDVGEGCGVQGCVGSTCKPGRTSCVTDAGMSGGCCDGTATCTDLETNPSHCGKCGVACAAKETCSNGTCVLSDCTGAAGGTACVGAGFFGACCGGVCTNTYTDSQHCGGCGGACPTGASCVARQCTGATGPVWCGAATSPPCGPGKTCVVREGRCAEAACNGASEEGFSCAHADPASRGACCGGSCQDLRSDCNNCGNCGKVCESGSWCNGGYCQKKVTCDATNSGTPCNLSNDKTGLCCDGTCIEARSKDSCGACGAGCPANATCRADGTCVEPDGDIAYCRSSSDCPAGRLCASSARCVKPTCAAGASGGKCAFGRTTRGEPGTCCDGACVDLSQDKDACGKCGTSCPSGLCAGGACVPEPRPCFGTCGPGQQCAEGTCVGTCSVALSSLCATSSGSLGVCCDQFFSSTCKDIDSDAENCGGCGVRCPAGQTCQSGVCSGASGICSDGHQGAYCDLASGESKLCCGGGCVDIKSDSKNCGACGKACQTDESCIGSACVLTACTATSSGRTCRVGSASGICCNGTCTDTQTSEAHCGSCNKGCGSGAECRSGRCAVPTCSPSSSGAPCFRASDAVGRCCGTAGCVDTTTDAKHCLGCGIACGAGQVCANGL